MNNIRYFRATHTDIDIVMDHRLHVLTFFKGAQPSELIASVLPQLRETMHKALEQGTYMLWMAESEGTIVGSGGLNIVWRPGNFLNPGGKCGYIMSMYTLPEYRGRGICTELVRRLIDTGKESGIEHFELHATKAGEPVYRKLGFILHDEPTYRKTELIGADI